MDAETLVREELLMKTPQRARNSFSETSSPSRKPKGAAAVVPDPLNHTHPKIKRVQEWLEHQPVGGANCPPPPLTRTATTTDCEASGEYTGEVL